MALFGAISAGIGIAKGVTNIANSVLGSSSSFSDCGAKQRQVEKQFRQYFTNSDIQILLNQHTHGEIRGRSVSDLAFHFLGGDDCNVTSSAGQRWSSRVASLLNQRKAEQEQKIQTSNFANSAQKQNFGSSLNSFLPIASLGLIALLIFRS